MAGNRSVSNATMDEDKLKKLWAQRPWKPFTNDAAGYEEWAEFTKRAYPVLVTAAQSKQTITYSEIGSKIGLFSEDYFVPKISSIVGACSYYEEQFYGRPLISAIAVNKDTGEPSEGFWGLPGIPPKVDRVEFWAKEVERVFQTWEGGREIVRA